VIVLAFASVLYLLRWGGRLRQAGSHREMGQPVAPKHAGFLRRVPVVVRAVVVGIVIGMGAANLCPILQRNERVLMGLPIAGTASEL
jgi:hypothetical protein